MFTGGLTQQGMTAQVQAKMTALREALNDAMDLHNWLAAFAAADLVTAFGYSTADASAILSAVADASALCQVYLSGQAPSSYPQVTGPYVYATSIRAIIGPG